MHHKTTPAQRALIGMTLGKMDPSERSDFVDCLRRLTPADINEIIEEGDSPAWWATYSVAAEGYKQPEKVLAVAFATMAYLAMRDLGGPGVPGLGESDPNYNVAPSLGQRTRLDLRRINYIARGADMIEPVMQFLSNDARLAVLNVVDGVIPGDQGSPGGSSILSLAGSALKYVL
jgi:hypothetical protein